MIIIIGKGHGGTRAISRTLVESGVYMGNLSKSYDHIPPHLAYEACQIIGKHMSLPWNFSFPENPPIEFVKKMEEYLAPILSHEEPRGWKLPETTLMYPWIKKMFPEAYFIHWVRNPLDSIRERHQTDDLERFNVPSFSDNHPTMLEALLDKRYQSWLYQEVLIENVPRPQRFLRVWFEDFVLRQEQTLQKLEKFLSIPLIRIPVDKKAVGRYISAR
jgi:hypothetical protein